MVRVLATPGVIRWLAVGQSCFVADLVVAQRTRHRPGSPGPPADAPNVAWRMGKFTFGMDTLYVSLIACA